MNYNKILYKLITLNFRFFRFRIVLAIIGLIFFLLPNFVLKAELQPIDISGEIQNITSKASILVDKTSSLKYPHIKKSDAFKVFGKEATGFKQSLKNTYWFKFNLRTTNKRPLFLTVNSSNIDYVDFYKIENGKEVIVNDGDMVPWTKKEIKYRYPVFSINPGEEGSLYFLRIKSPGTTALNIQVMDELNLLKDQRKEMLWDLTISASMIILFLYNLFIYFSTGDNKYGVYCLYLFIVWVSQALLIEGWLNFFTNQTNPLLSNNSVVIGIFLQSAISFYLTAVFLDTKKWMPRTDKALTFFTILYTLMAFLSFSSSWIDWIIAKTFYRMVTFFSIFVFVVAIVAFVQGKKTNWTTLRSAKFYLPAFGAYLIGALALSWAKSGKLPFTYLSQHYMKIGVLIELIILSLGLADIINSLRISEKKKALELAKSNELLNTLNAELEDRVAQRTVELSEALNNTESLLHNMNQAVFVVSQYISEDETIMEFIIEDKVVSSFSEEIFKRDIKGKSVYDILFSDIDFKSEDGVAIKSAFECSFGMSDIQWDQSLDYLPTRVEITYEKRKTVLRVNYKPLWDEDENLEKIMIVAEDVTDLEKLQKQMEEQREKEDSYHRILSELAPPRGKDLASHMKQVKTFMVSTKKQIAEIISTIKVNSEILAKDQNSTEVKTLLRNIHTIKGNSRAVGLLTLSTKVHNLENNVNDWKSEDGTFSVDSQDNILDSLTSFVTEDISIYVETAKDIFSVKLIDGKEGGKDKEEDVRYVEIHNNIFEKIKASISKFFQGKDNPEIKEVKELFAKIDYTPVVEIFHSFEGAINDLLRSMNKKINYEYKCDDVFLNSNDFQLLNDSLNHILRNSIDHGIEDLDARVKNNKEEVGQLFVGCEKTSDGYQIIVKDDGNGIDKGKLVEKALDKKLLTREEASGLSDHEKLNLIFASGLTTKDNVTDVSGRGIGMDVVKTNIESLNGTLKITSKVKEGTELIISIVEKAA